MTLLCIISCCSAADRLQNGDKNDFDKPTAENSSPDAENRQSPHDGVADGPVDGDSHQAGHVTTAGARTPAGDVNGELDRGRQHEVPVIDDDGYEATGRTTQSLAGSTAPGELNEDDGVSRPVVPPTPPQTDEPDRGDVPTSYRRSVQPERGSQKPDDSGSGLAEVPSEHDADGSTQMLLERDGKFEVVSADDVKAVGGTSKSSYVRPPPSVELDGEDLAASGDQLLVERDGKFRMVSAGDVMAEDRPRSRSSSSSSSDVALRISSLSVKTTRDSGARGTRSRTSSQRMATLPLPASRSKSAAALPPMRRRSLDLQSTHRLSEDQKRQLGRQQERRAELALQEEQQRRETDERKRRECDEAFDAWLRRKRVEAAQRRRERAQEMREEREKNNKNKVWVCCCSPAVTALTLHYITLNFLQWPK